MTLFFLQYDLNFVTSTGKAAALVKMKSERSVLFITFGVTTNRQTDSEDTQFVTSAGKGY